METGSHKSDKKKTVLFHTHLLLFCRVSGNFPSSRLALELQTNRFDGLVSPGAPLTCGGQRQVMGLEAVLYVIHSQRGVAQQVESRAPRDETSTAVNNTQAWFILLRLRHP